MAMPSAHGLFHRAMIISGSLALDNSIEKSKRLTQALLAEVGGYDTRKLQAMPAQAFLTAADAADRNLGPSSSPRGPQLPGWLPLPGTAVLPESPFAASAPRLSANIPLIIGCTRDEFGSFPLLGDTHFQSAEQFPLSEADLRGELVKTWSDKADAMLAAAKTDFAGEKPANLRNIINSIFFRQGALDQLGKQYEAGGRKVFSYYFVWQTPLLDGSPGAFHTQDLYFWFDNIARNENTAGNTPEAQRISAAMSDSLVAFLRTGSPSTPAGIELPRILDSRSWKVNPTLLIDGGQGRKTVPPGAS